MSIWDNDTVDWQELIMNSQAVLVLGNHAHSHLVEVLSGLGFDSQVWGSMQHSLDKLRHNKFAAILVDLEFTRADVLEFILNVRDLDREVPVVVIGKVKDGRIDNMIARQANTKVLTDFENRDRFVEKLAQVLNGSENKGE